MAKKKSLKKRIWNIIVSAVILLFGNALYSFTTVMFIRPSGLVMGGVTGVSFLIEHFNEGIEISYFILAMNVVLYIIGVIVLGKHFAITTGASTFLYPMGVWVWERALGDIDILEYMPKEGNMILYSAIAGLLIGIAVGVVVRNGASTGGSDIPPLVLNKLFKLPVGAGMLIVDGAIIAAQFVAYKNLDRVMYGIIMVVIYSFVINQVQTMGSGKVEISVMSEHYNEIRATIMAETGRGITLLSARRGMTGEHCKMLISVISTRQLARVKRIVTDIDPNAFMVITRVSDVSGNGFSFFKGDKKLDKDELLK